MRLLPPEPGAVAPRPAFLVTIDTEGDNVWARPRYVTTCNARCLPRFQAICERFGFKPTYLVNHEMAEDAAFCELGRDALARGVAEIGMHMHAWDSPPIVPLGASDWFDQPYAFEYPADLVFRKAQAMTRLIEDRFGIAATSHRAGRWGLDAAYARGLVRLGYRVDCSVTPFVTWREHPGAPGGTGGPDFSSCPSHSYWIDLCDITRSGTGPLLEVPMTIMEGARPWYRTLARHALGRRGPRIIWLRPNGANLADLLYIVECAARERRPYIQFTLHSSELMPGGSPTFRTSASIEKLYRHMEVLFGAASAIFEGCTLTRFAEEEATRLSAQRVEDTAESA